MAKVNLKISISDGSYKGSLDGVVKFPADNFIHEDEEFYLIMNGVNYRFLTTDKKDSVQYCLDCYRRDGDGFFRDFRGSFCGALFDKRKKKWLIFTNHIGDQKLFYALTDQELVISSDFFRVVSELGNLKKSQDLDRSAAYDLLSYGYMVGDKTLVQGIKRLIAGHYLVLEERQLSRKDYYIPENQTDSSLEFADCIEQLDHRFREAVRLEFDKDRLYGYDHLAAMSGGLDSRMTNWVARDLGYHHITNYTFSQYGYLDMTIAREVSAYLQHEWLYKALDHGNFLKDIDTITSLTYGLIPYYFMAHGYSMRRLINHDAFGISHSGGLGDVVIGTYLPGGNHSKINIKATSGRLLSRTENDFSGFRNNEMAHLAVRGFNGIITAQSVAQTQTEVASPFLDIDFLDFCLSVPVKYRAYHRLYKQWILKKYPDAAKFKWEKLNARISEKTVIIRGKEVLARKIPEFLIEGIRYNLGIQKGKAYSSFHMNPFDYWYNTNPGLGKYFEQYFLDHIDLLQDRELRDDCQQMFREGSVVEKMQVLSLLSAMKRIFS